MWIYKIENIKNEKVYIGQTTAKIPAVRWTQHIKALQSGNHSNEHLQRSWNKYGPDVWSFSVLREVNNIIDLNASEQYFIDLYGSMNESNGYNKRGGGSVGRMSNEAKVKMSKSHSGKVLSEAHKNSIRKSTIGKNKGKPRHPAAGRKLSFDMDLVDDWIKQGKSLTEIYTNLGLTRGAVSKAMIRYWDMGYKERKRFHEYI